ncbi:hypothetical protein N0398_21635 [Providencia rettgeri]|nr:hypothetical protein [Providencia rettgeri]
MDYYGLFPQFKINRPLNESEFSGKLEQKTRVNIDTKQLMPDLKVITLNSKYLEIVDKFYSSKGILSLVTFIFSFAFIGAFIWVIIDTIIQSDYEVDSLLATSIIAFTFLPIGLCMLFLLKKEWFAWTHYPIRFDRKNQLVHATRIDGSVFTVPWQDIFFTTGLNHRKEIGKDYYISGHVLAEDGITIIDTFCLPASHGNLEELRAHWEFVRRYMEEGPQGMKERIPFCLPIANKKESFGFTFFYSMTQHNGTPVILFPITVPLAFLYAIPRYIAILTSRRPVWPDNIQKQAIVDENDPYYLDASTNPKNLWKTFFK